MGACLSVECAQFLRAQVDRFGSIDMLQADHTPVGPQPEALHGISRTVCIDARFPAR